MEEKMSERWVWFKEQKWRRRRRRTVNGNRKNMDG